MCLSPGIASMASIAHNVDYSQYAKLVCPHCGQLGESESYRDGATRSTRFCFRLHEKAYVAAISDHELSYTDFGGRFNDLAEMALLRLAESVEECSVVKTKKLMLELLIKQAQFSSGPSLYVTDGSSHKFGSLPSPGFEEFSEYATTGSSMPFLDYPAVGINSDLKLSLGAPKLKLELKPTTSRPTTPRTRKLILSRESPT